MRKKVCGRGINWDWTRSLTSACFHCKTGPRQRTSEAGHPFPMRNTCKQGQLTGRAAGAEDEDTMTTTVEFSAPRRRHFSEDEDAGRRAWPQRQEVPRSVRNAGGERARRTADVET